MNYKKDGTPLVVLAGKDYGMGSSRDWAAKGTCLLGVKAVIAESFERIHRSNLVGMGVLPLIFKPGQTPDTLGLIGRESSTSSLPASIEPRCDIKVVATITRAEDGQKVEFSRDLPARHAGGGRLLPQRRHPADRAPQASEREPEGGWGVRPSGGRIAADEPDRRGSRRRHELAADSRT